MTNKGDSLDVEITLTLNLTHCKHDMPNSWDNPSEYFFTRKFKQSYGPEDGDIKSLLRDAIKKVASEMQNHAQSVNLQLKKPESSTSNTAYSDPEHGFNNPVSIEKIGAEVYNKAFKYNEEW